MQNSYNGKIREQISDWLNFYIYLLNFCLDALKKTMFLICLTYELPHEKAGVGPLVPSSTGKMKKASCKKILIQE